MRQYIWQDSGWPELSWRGDAFLSVLGEARQAQGRLLGQARLAGIEHEARVLVDEAVTTAAIEGEQLSRQSVRSSVARRLGLSDAGLPPTERHVDGLVEMLADATRNHASELSADRLFGWHAALFSTGFSGMQRIRVGAWRNNAEPMRVVSGPIGRERVHFEAPPSTVVAVEMERFFTWWAASSGSVDGIIRAGIAHLHFVTVHPFDDGNGRIARALTDMALAQDEKTGVRLYSMSAQIAAERNDYYAALERAQRRGLDVTDWLSWFVGCLCRSINRAAGLMVVTLDKARFWQRHAETDLNTRQKKVLNRLLDTLPEGFEGGITNRKYVSMTKTSRETAKRDIAALVRLGILVPRDGGGRSTSYELAWP